MEAQALWSLFAQISVVLSIVVASVAWVVRTLSASAVNANTVMALQLRIDTVERAFANFRERVATDYVTNALLQEVEARIMHQLDRIYAVVAPIPKGHS